MLKKLLNIGAFACAMLVAVGANAQSQDFPRTGFWSNWSVGGDVMATRQSGRSYTATKLGEDHKIGGWGVGLNVMAKKQLNYDWRFRATVGSPMLVMVNPGKDGFGVVTVGFDYSLLPYKEGRKGDLYLMIDGGATVNPGEAIPAYGLNALYADGGIGYAYKICEKSSLFAEASFGVTADIPNPIKAIGHCKVNQLNFMLGLGYLYHFGLTATDQELLAQKAQLTQESFDALNDQVNTLTKEVTTSKQAEQRLQNTVNELEERMASADRKGGRNAYSDSLQTIINQVKDNQLNFYALPFSILYPVDGWNIPAAQNDKVKAIARVMKDNENVKFNIVGFCDYTGSDAYNMKLSQKRAEELKRVLVKKYGIDEDRISCEWKGKGLAFGDLKYSINRRASVYRVIE